MVTNPTTPAQAQGHPPLGQLAFADADGCATWLRNLPVTNIPRYYEEILDQLRRVGEAEFAPRERGRIAELMREPVSFLHTELARRYAGKPQPAAAREKEASDQALALWQALWVQYSACLKPLLEGDAELQGVKAKVLQRGLWVGKQLVLVHGLARRTPGAAVWQELHAYFRHLIEMRRAEPEDDLVSELIRGEIDGAPLTEVQLVSYCELLVEAGNETTRNAISGGLLAFSEHPDEWQKLRDRPELLPDAVEEILRWVSPISHFTRTATEECEVNGVPIRAGQQVALYFASANRDEEVFEDPFAFRVDRRPNPHLAFGFGEHFCMGAHVARVELETIFRHLVARLESFEVVGPVERLRSIVNGSIKRLPFSYSTTEMSTERMR